MASASRYEADTDKATVVDEPGLQRLQTATWLAIDKEPPLTETVSPNLKLGALLVRPPSPAIQVRRLTKDWTTMAFALLPAGSKPFSLPQWSASGEHVSVMFEGPSAEGKKLYFVFVLRPADQATQQAQLETVPDSAEEPASNELAALWAPSAPTLIIVRQKPMQQTSQCFRRSRLKAVGCQLVYHDAKGSCEAQLQCSPDGTKLAYRAANQAVAIHYISTGATIVVDPSCGKWLRLTFAPSSSYILCVGKLNEQERQQAAFLSVTQPPSAQAACSIPGSLLMGMAWSAKDCVAIACGTADGQAGTLAFFTVVAGPALQPLHTLPTGGFVEDLSFSPSGIFLCYLDQGGKCSMPALSPTYELKPESEAVVLHLPSQRARRFASRKEAREPCNSDRYMTSVPTGMSSSTSMNITKWPGRAGLWWQGSSLMSYGPGSGYLDFVPASHGYIRLCATGFSANVSMPCKRLNLG